MEDSQSRIEVVKGGVYFSLISRLGNGISEVRHL